MTLKSQVLEGMRSEVTEKTVNSQWSCSVKGQEAGAERQPGIG